MKAFQSIFSSFIFPVIILGICSCASGNKAAMSSDKYVIDFASTLNNESSIDLSNYASEIQYIPIETNDSFLLADITGFHAGDDYLYVICRETQSLYQLSTEGKLVKKIGNRGRAKNEYLAIRSIYSDKSSVTLEFGRKIITYNAVSGDIERICEPSDIKGIEVFKSILFLDNGSFATLNGSEDGTENQLLIIDNQNQIIDSAIVFKTQMKNIKTAVPTKNIVTVNGPAIKQPSVELTLPWQYSPKLSSYNGNIEVMSPFMDTILVFNGAEHQLYAIVDYSNITEEQRFEPTINPEFVIDALSKKEAEKFIIFKNLKGDKYLFDKEKGNTYRLEKGLNDNIENCEPFWPDHIIGNKMYRIVSADLFIEEAEKSNSQKMKDVAATLTDESNPVIVVATLK